MSSEHVNPVGIVFAAILVTAFVVGVSATTYYAWIQPAFARYRARKQLQARSRQAKTSRFASSPDPDNHQLNTPSFGSPAKDLEKGDAILVKEQEVVDDVLPLPKPAYARRTLDRFSASSRDGVWWIV